MDKKLQRLIQIATEMQLSYQHERKLEFHRLGKAVLKQVAQILNLPNGSYEIRSNMGGIAVGGEVTLHGENIYIQFSQSLSKGSFMFRSCKGRKDYSGGTNQWMQWKDMENLTIACNRFKAVMI